MNRFFLSAIFFAGIGLGGACYAQNPIINTQFTADPSALVVGDRVYLFPSHDIPAPDDYARKDWFCMADYHVYSSADLVSWTDHGVILDQKDVPWGNPKGYSMWAPDCAEHNGKYYFYFPDAPSRESGSFGFRCGVAIADNPSGPYTAEEHFIDGVFGIDPCIFKDDDGQGYLVWPSRGIKICRLKDNWTELDSRIVPSQPDPNIPDSIRRRFPAFPQVESAITVDEVPTKGLVEGPYMFKANGKYYVTFPWARENTEVLAYCMSDRVEGPYKFMGVFFDEHPNGCWTNHHSIINFKGQWYLFYHRNDYSPRFDKNRSVCIDSLTFNPDGTIQKVIPTFRGVGVTEGTSHIQMDRYSRIGGGATITYNDTLDCFQGWKTILPAGGWVSYANVRVRGQVPDPETLDLNCWVRGQVPDPETLDLNCWVRYLSPDLWGRYKTVNIRETDLSLKVNAEVNGYYELVLVNDGTQTVEVDWISLGKRQPPVPALAGGISTGTYRNLFVEAGYSADAVEAKLQEVFNDVFTGRNRCYFEAGKDKAYMCDIKNDDVRTEGMSYGMMIAVQFDRRDIFDRLWRWAKEYMQIKEGPMEGYFRWSCKVDGTPNAPGPASDGELYFITSLIFASNRWGNSGEINYLSEAQDILSAIQPREMEFRGRRHFVSLIDAGTDLITFTPGVPFTDPSYHIPAFYEVWARYADDGRASYWRECARKSREYLHKSINPITGLNPDYNNFDGSLLRNGQLIGDAFRYDSWRVPMNVALDYSWSCSDRVWQQQYGETFQNFLYSKGIDTFVDQYNVDGSQPSELLRAGNYPEKLRHSMGLVATAAAASILCSHAKSYEFIDRLWNTPHVKDSDGFFDAYYDGLLRLFAFMHLSGHYRVIEKTPQLEDYFLPVDKNASTASPDSDGFVRRWTLHDPISKPNRSNTVFTDSYLNETFPSPVSYSKKDKAAWHTYDSQLPNVKLYRFATCTGQQKYGVIFWVRTIIECDEDIQGVRLSIGSNSASKWWLDNQEVALLSGDRRMVRDDMVTAPLTLHKGQNVITGAIINGPGMSDFCLRVVNNSGQPLTNLKIHE